MEILLAGLRGVGFVPMSDIKGVAIGSFSFQPCTEESGVVISVYNFLLLLLLLAYYEWLLNVHKNN